MSVSSRQRRRLQPVHKTNLLSVRMFTLRPFWAVVLASSLAAGSPTYAFQESVTAEGTEAVTGQPNASRAASAGQPGRILARALELVPTIISERNAPRTLALQNSGGSTGTGVSG